MAKTRYASSQTRARAERERRKRARQKGHTQAAAPLSFRAFVNLVSPRYKWYRHCEVLAAVLQRVADGEMRRLMVFMPPRHGKSELVSRLFTAYYLYRHPERFVGINSYAAELAYTLSRAARENYQSAGGVLKSDAAAVKHWETTKGGGLWAAGVGGPITGKGFHLGVIDDPLKNEEEASSETIRKKQKEWYGSTFYTREEQDEEAGVFGAIVVVQTRWHEDDLSGWLLAEEIGDEEPERWHIVSFPAVAEADSLNVEIADAANPADVQAAADVAFPTTCTVEPDWRQPGEALCPERRPLSRLKKIERRIGSYFWNALFQQRPRPKSGGLFKWDSFQVVEAVPAIARRVRYWDTAGTEGGGDYTVGVLMAKSPDGVFYVEHVHRGQWSPNRKEQEIKDTAGADAKKYGPAGVHQWFEREAGIGGTERTQAIVRLLAGNVVHVEPATGSKEARAEPFASQVEAGNVRLLKAEWNNAYRREHCDFPRGKNDDQVDASSGAHNKLALTGEGKASGVSVSLF